MTTLITWKSFACASLLASVGLGGCHQEKEHEEHEEVEARLIATSPLIKDTLVTRDYVCQIHSNRHIEVKALERGYLETVHVKEGQHVETGDLMFKILPLVYQADLKKAEAEAQAAKLEYENTRRLFENKVVSQTELALTKAKFERAEAEVNLAQAHLGFTELHAPFPGLSGRLELRQGSLVDEGELLTTLSDNSEMWVYFNVPEAEYLSYMSQAQPEDTKTVELMMANGQTFKHKGRINVIESEFNSETGTIPFRADFPNPESLLRHGETGNILMKTMVKGAMLIPQKATFEILDHHYVFVVDQDNVVEQKRILINEELEDLFIVGSGLKKDDKIIFEGLRHVRTGKEVEYEFEPPEEVIKSLKVKSE
ncbi:MAG: efflux RND transporter periplasmic adaptor subunit [Verrucomicrobiales bacterium]|nr:efflux RND transporter periplasmic adaptor subunit [Verrucomicrobiales bacterium]